MTENPQDTYYADMQEEVPESQVLPDYTPRTISDELQFTEDFVNVIIPMNSERYLKLKSALETGAFWTYPNQWLEVLSWFWQAMSIGGDMDCDDVANCIASSESVLNALLQQLSSNGFSQGGNGENSSTNVTMSPSKAAENLLPPDYSCDDEQLMATARTVVQKFDEFTQDFFDQLELLTNPLELVNITSDGIPVADTLGNIAAFADFVAQTVRETYQASYNNAAENEIACALYCAMKEDCLLSYDMLVDVLNELQVVEYPTPADTDDFQSIADWLMSLDLEVGVATVAAFHLLIALAMKFGGGTVFEMAGLVGLKTIIAGTVGLLDTSWTECDCAEAETPQTYWYMVFDFAISPHGWLSDRASTGYVNGGFESVSSDGGLTQVVVNENSFGATAWWLAGVRVTSLRRGSIGNGSNDFKRLNVYPNENRGGTVVQAWNHNFITENTNETVHSKLDFVDNSISFKSVQYIERVDGAYVANANICRTTKIELWGFNHGDIKPAGAIWVNARI